MTMKVMTTSTTVGYFSDSWPSC